MKKYAKPTIETVNIDKAILLMGTSNCGHHDNGNHYGHNNGNGKHNGHGNPNNPWHGCDSFNENPFGNNSIFE